jgi:D-amino-acid dehydrogenase
MGRGVPLNQPARGPGAISVVGAGVVGLSVAWALARDGWTVTIFDPNPPGSGASFGNSGSLSSGSVVPLAVPGALRSGLKMIADPNAPLAVRRRYVLRALPWLREFVRASDDASVRQVAGALLEILAPTLPAWRQVLDEIGANDLLRATGQLHLYTSHQHLAADAYAWRLREALGVLGERLKGAALAERQPGVAATYPIGMFLADSASILDPHGLCLRLADALARRGVRFVHEPVRALRADGTLEAAGRSWPAGACVLAAGAWSASLLQGLGVRVPLESQRGYHLQLAGHEVAPGVTLRCQVVPADTKVFIVPMREGVRCGGTVEFAGLRAAPAPRRFALLRSSLARVFPGMPAQPLGEVREWMGHRPCLPDTLPVLGPLPGLPAVWTAFGHGHLGLTMSAVTGQWIAQALAGRAPPALARFSATRPTLRARLPAHA